MSKQPPSKDRLTEAAKDLFDYACRELSEAKKSGREQDRRRFFDLARAIEAAFPRVSLVPSPSQIEADDTDTGKEPSGGTGSVH